MGLPGHWAEAFHWMIFELWERKREVPLATGHDGSSRSVAYVNSCSQAGGTFFFDIRTLHIRFRALMNPVLASRNLGTLHGDVTLEKREVYVFFFLTSDFIMYVTMADTSWTECRCVISSIPAHCSYILITSRLRRCLINASYAGPSL